MSDTHRNSDQYMLRLPDGLRDQIKANALANGRSMNAEIIDRLTGEHRSLRDWFAGQAMAAILKDYGVDRHDLCAEAAYDMADAMLTERSKP